MKSVPAIAFDYRPSRWLAAAVVAVVALALTAIVACGLDVRLKLVLAVVVLAYATWALHGFLRPPFAQVAWHAAGHWRLRDAVGEERIGEFLRSTVLGALIVLVLRAGSKQVCAFVLLPDNCDAETRRRLRVRLSRTDAVDAH